MFKFTRRGQLVEYARRPEITESLSLSTANVENNAALLFETSSETFKPKLLTLDIFSNIDVSTATAGQSLVYDGAKWRPLTLTASGISLSGLMPVSVTSSGAITLDYNINQFELVDSKLNLKDDIITESKIVDGNITNAKCVLLGAAGLCDLASDQTLEGRKTFLNGIVSSAAGVLVPLVPTQNDHAASKQYVDSAFTLTVNTSEFVYDSSNILNLNSISGTKISDNTITSAKVQVNGATGIMDLGTQNQVVVAAKTFSSKISAPGGVGSLPTPVSSNDAATKDYVDSKVTLINSSQLATNASNEITIKDRAISENLIELNSLNTTHVQTAGSAAVMSLNDEQVVSAKKTMSGGVTGLPSPQNPEDAANKRYVDAFAMGVKYLVSCVAASATDTGLTGVYNIDDVVINSGDRVLMTGRSNPIENGIWLTNHLGSWSRPSDFSNGTASRGMAVFVTNGTLRGSTTWIVSSESGSDVVGTSSLNVVQFGAPSSFTASGGLVKSGVDISIDNGGVNLAKLASNSVDNTKSVLVGSTGLVDLASSQTISGAKTFSSTLTASAGVVSLPAPTNPNDAATKDYVDTNLSVQGAGLEKTGNTIGIATGGVTSSMIGSNSVDNTKTVLTGATGLVDLSSSQVVTGAKSFTSQLQASSGVTSLPTPTNLTDATSKDYVDSSIAASMPTGGQGITVNSGVVSIPAAGIQTDMIANGAITALKVINSGTYGIVKISGTQTITGAKEFTSAISASGGIANLPTPVQTHEAATKDYVDSALDGSYIINVTSNGTSYVLNGAGASNQSNPTMRLHFSIPYKFVVNTPGEPLYIKTTQTAGTADAVTENITNNGTDSGTILFTPSQDSNQQILYYASSNSLNHSGKIIVIREAPIDSVTSELTTNGSTLSITAGGITGSMISPTTIDRSHIVTSGISGMVDISGAQILTGVKTFATTPITTKIAIRNSSALQSSSISWNGSVNTDFISPSSPPTTNDSLVFMDTTGEIKTSSVVQSHLPLLSSANVFTTNNSFPSLETKSVTIKNTAETFSATLKFEGTSDVTFKLPLSIPSKTLLLGLEPSGTLSPLENPEIKTLIFRNSSELNKCTLTYEGIVDTTLKLPPSLPAQNDSLLIMSTTGEMAPSTRVVSDIPSLSGSNAFSNMDNVFVSGVRARGVSIEHPSNLKAAKLTYPSGNGYVLKMPASLPTSSNKVFGIDNSGQISYAENPNFTTVVLSNGSSPANNMTLAFDGSSDFTLTMPSSVASSSDSLVTMNTTGRMTPSSIQLSNIARTNETNTFSLACSFSSGIDTKGININNSSLSQKVSLTYPGTTDYDLKLPVVLPSSKSVLTLNSSGDVETTRLPETDGIKISSGTHEASLLFTGSTNLNLTLPSTAATANDSLVVLSTTGQFSASNVVLSNIATLNGNNIFANPVETNSLKLSSGNGISTLSFGGNANYNLILPTDLPNPLNAGPRIVTTSSAGQMDYLSFETSDIMRKGEVNSVSGEIHLLTPLKFDEGPDVAQIKNASIAAPDDFASITGLGYTIKLPETDLPAVTSFVKITSGGKLHYGTIASAFNDLELDSLALKDDQSPIQNKITLVAPAAVDSSYQLTLPSETPIEHEVKSEASYGTQITAKTNCVLESDANGNTQWRLMASICPIGVVLPYPARPYLGADPTATINDLNGNSQQNIVAPPGWVFCWGQSMSRALYPSLFALFGTLYGTGSNGNATFNLPDYRGTFLRALDNSKGRDSNSNRTLGSYQDDQFKSHNHSYNDHNPSSTVEVDRPDSFGSTAFPFDRETTTGRTTGSTGGAETNPKNIAVEYIIRTGRQEVINQHDTRFDAYSSQLV